MGGLVCSNCDTKIRAGLTFCSECGRPTPFASSEEFLQWDLRQWRAHKDDAVVQTGSAAPAHASGPVVLDWRRLRAAHRSRPEPDRVIDLDADNPFLYRACVACNRTDWIVRTSANEDGSWNYYCFRCGRSFKTDLRLPHGVKPFATLGGILAVLAALANFL